MQLVHRTNYWGKYIDSSNTDDEVDFDAIWAMALNDGDWHCCPGFGRRWVEVVNSDFRDEYDGWWSVFLVSERRGHSDGHYFYKFVAIPQGTYSYGKKGCQQRGWSYQGEFEADNARDQLESILDYWLNLDDDDFIHIHIGIWMDQLYTGG
ncbi:expressed unknown protein [Seminavis robusta]|uniref:Uncharacterized protein n=1 Tax=Seminavis robusta TaxID=568900 RepID=A0A9N8HHA0_9STRA|nr:expressed unknown protein [Seminavis robusta]|eukprot:Sro551_g164920.1 n/a (151) ;mRNA; f:42890-43342